MKMGLGMAAMILGILGIIIGGAFIGDNYHKVIGTIGVIVGVILIIAGLAWWMMKERKAPVAAAPQPAQPAKTP
jgi:uncharacterized membrane protein